ncbi:MAG: alpha/beta hydrolase [Mycobacterium sp.]|nr:alpha/beta hydrolase [Mycobacterium sp.]
MTSDLKVNGKRLHLVDVNNHAGGDEVVLFLHGISASWRWFVEIIPEMARSHRVVALDLPGFGHSEYSSAHTSFTGLARSVEATCAELGVAKVTVVGHSMGSIVGTRLAICSPGLVDKLVITGGPILSLTELPRRPAQTVFREPLSVATLLAELMTIGMPVPGFIASRIASSPKLLKLLLGAFVERPECLDPDVMMQVMSALGARGSFPVLFSTFAEDPNQGLDQISCQTKIIRGPGDPLSSRSDVERFLRLVPTASVVEIAGTGHWPHLEKPQEFVAELRAFLGR